MSREFFGTDGIRGRANEPPMTAEMALKVAMATAKVLRTRREGSPTDRVVIGKDTRLSCYMLEQAMTAGFLSMGMNVILTGPVPTPGVAMLTRSLRCDLGVMISASHNPFQDNGIKLFGSDGYKLDDEIELEIEAALKGDLNEDLALPADLGKATRFDDAIGRYAESVKRALPRGSTLEGLKVVVDCAHGAAYKVAPQVLWELEAEVISIGVQPNGRNINDGYGATSTGRLQEAVVDNEADIGIALDGDADRLIMVDETGTKIDGDQLMAALALSMHEKDELEGPALVTTVMSNLGLERLLKSKGIDLIRTSVGDRYVMEAMRADGYNLGGEQSGHIILSDLNTTGDGLQAAIRVCSTLKESGHKASEALKLFEPLPQILRNVEYDPKTLKGTQPMEKQEIKDAIEKATADFANDGRVLVRPSGTEPLIRVMAEGDDQSKVETIVGDLCAVIEKAVC
ncbi:MAG: phosphoglucosamine mutase [Alphaproteobacteria bacterium]|nr:phosphoglucosamine mutase [Alphaproteobacteria bacterium]